MYDVKKVSERQEKRVAKEVGGRTTPASGAIENFKGDVRSSKFLIECKTTEKDKYSLKFEVWEKIYKESLKDGFRIPVMCIELNDGETKLAIVENDTINFSALHELGDFDAQYAYPKSPKSSTLITARCTWSIVDVINGKKKVRGLQSCSLPDINLSIIPWSVFLAVSDKI